MRVGTVFNADPEEDDGYLYRVRILMREELEFSLRSKVLLMIFFRREIKIFVGSNDSFNEFFE